MYNAGAEAKKVYNEAQDMLRKVSVNGSLKAHGMVAFYPANSVGDDIEVYNENGDVLQVLRGLRQQVSHLDWSPAGPDSMYMYM